VNISEALYQGITDGKYMPDSESTDPRVIIANLRAVFPSETAAARFAGIPRSSWRRWIRGARPNLRGFAALQAAQRRVRLPRDREAWMRQGHIVIRGWLLFSTDAERFNRLITDWPHIPKAPARAQAAGMQSRILDAWLAGNDVAAVDALMSVVTAGVSFHAGKGVDVKAIDITSIRWYRTRGEALQAMRLKEF
jgi:hypothetical protein